MLEGIGEDPDREGFAENTGTRGGFLRRTDRRNVGRRGAQIVALPGDSHDEMVIVKDISIASVCEHHLAPFVGKMSYRLYSERRAHRRTFEIGADRRDFRRRLQVQERLTQQIAQTLFDELKPIGVMVVIEAEHTCMTLRGVKKPGAKTITSTVLGGFRKDSRTRAEAMSLIKG